MSFKSCHSDKKAPVRIVFTTANTLISHQEQQAVICMQQHCACVKKYSFTGSMLQRVTTLLVLLATYLLLQVMTCALQVK